MASTSRDVDPQVEVPVNIREIGFTVLSKGGDHPLVDIIFVHGLQGHPRNTWTYQATEAKSTVKFWKRHEKSDASNGAVVFWPLDLLSEDLPRARIMTYGYDSAITHWFKGAAMKVDILSYGQSLLNGLEAIRRQCQERPLIFVVHSLGGLILKDTLRRARTATLSRLKSVYSSVEAILFLGTPHRGGSYVNLGLTLRKIAVISGFSANDKLLRDLKFDSSVAKLLQEEFSRLLEDKGPKVFIFQEAKGLSGVGLLSGKVVEDYSSSLDYPNGQTDFIDANHMGMCRFSGREDPGYIKVKDALLLCLEDLPVEYRQRSRTEQACLQSLAFLEMSQRQNDIEPQAPETCQWLMDHENYIKWLDSGGFLWVMGNPGTGKSTLLKYVIGRCKANPASKKDVIVSFFFHGRGKSIQKAPIGLFRSILHQIMDQLPDWLSAFTLIFRQRTATLGEYGKKWEWHETDLRDFLLDMGLRQSSSTQIKIYIDALDEGGEENAQALLTFFSQIASPSLHICISCRYYPVISLQGNLTVHVEDENARDLEIYIRQELSHGSWESSEARELEKQMLARALGSFQWAVLVLRELLRLNRIGRSMKEVLDKLRQLPRKLNDLYAELISGIDEEDKSESLHLMQWVLFAIEPLSLAELRFAMAIDADSTCTSISECMQSPRFAETDDEMGKRATHLSAGLVEVIEVKDLWYYADPNETPRMVQFIHQSVADYLLSTQMQVFYPNPMEGFVGRCHFRLSRSCIKYSSMNEIVMSKMMLWKSRKRFPFLDYSVRHWITHAKEVEAAGISQRDLLHMFSWPSKKLISRWLELHPLAGYTHITSETTLLHIVLSPKYNFLSILEAADDGYPDIEIDCPDGNGGTPLHMATAAASLPAVNLLLRKGAKVDFQDKNGRTPLSMAVLGGDAVTKTLIENGAQVEIVDGSGRSPLSHAAKEGKEAIIKMLVKAGASIDSRDEEGQTPLHWAAICSKPIAVEALLECGAQANVKDHNGRTPLHWAALASGKTTIKALLKYGAEIDIEDNAGKSPISYIAERSASYLQWLKEYLGGKDDEDASEEAESVGRCAAPVIGAG